MITENELLEIIDNVGYWPTYGLKVAREQGRYYIQVIHERPDAITGRIELGKGGKVFLSEHMTESEIVRKALGAFLAYAEHEVREGFTYLGAQVFGPHLDVRALAAIADVTDVRTPIGAS